MENCLECDQENCYLVWRTIVDFPDILILNFNKRPDEEPSYHDWYSYYSYSKPSQSFSLEKLVTFKHDENLNFEQRLLDHSYELIAFINHSGG